MHPLDPYLSLNKSHADALRRLENSAREYEKTTNNQGVFSREQFWNKPVEHILNCDYGFVLAKRAYIGHVTPAPGDIPMRFKILELAALSAFRDNNAEYILKDIDAELWILEKELFDAKSKINTL